MLRKKYAKLILFTISITSLFILTGCAANLLPKTLETTISNDATTKGKEILKQAIDAQGYNNIKNKATYTVTGTDTWQGFFGAVGKLWPQKKSKIRLTYPLSTFDGHIEYLDGKEKGFKATLINDHYYVQDESGQYIETERDKKVIFGIEAYKFFNEIAIGSNTGDIIAYVEEKNIRGKNYDVLFVTWGSKEPNETYDQYLLYVNQETKLIEQATYTIRENYLAAPGSAMIYGTIIFSDFREVDGFKFPFKQTVFTFDAKKNMDDYIHEFIVESLQFTDKPFSETVSFTE